MIQIITNVNGAINSFVCGLPTLILLVGTGILMTCLTKGFQVSHIGHWIKNTIGGLFAAPSPENRTENRRRPGTADGRPTASPLIFFVKKRLHVVY